MSRTAATLAFDVYGTLVDPAGMADHLRTDAGENASALALLWRQKQLEYAFRRGLMRCYADFTVCTTDALKFAFASFGLALSRRRLEELLELYCTLPAYAEVEPSLKSLRGDYRLAAFSNGTGADVERVLRHAGLVEYFPTIVSVDEVRSFKPDPAVYQHLQQRLHADDGTPIILVSGNAWDVIGARHAGLKTVWVQRSPQQILDPWDIKPDHVISDLRALLELRL